MSRHRNVRSMNYSDEYDGYDDVYGHSVEDDYSVSPSSAAFMYDRANNRPQVSVFLNTEEDIAEEDDEYYEDLGKRPELSDIDEAKLRSCLDEARSVIGDSVPDNQLIQAILSSDFDISKALDKILNLEPAPKRPAVESPKPQRPVYQRHSAAVVDNKEAEANPVITVALTPTRPVKGFEIPSSKSQGGGLTAGTQSPRLGRRSPDIEVDKKKDESRTPVSSRSKGACANADAEYKKERGDSKEVLHMVVIGHVDAGKSTLMGHLLFKMGQVSSKLMHKYEQESKKLGKQSFVYAWILDETGEERCRGITMDVGQSKFETELKVVNVLDAPGHKDFIPNMITGASQADVALLVVDSTRGEFETGFESGGQTREHALLVRSLGVNQLCVVVNKLDTVDWSEDRFKEICGKLGLFLKQAGFKEKDVSYVPCSGLSGTNLAEPPSPDISLSKWYTGPTLVQVIDKFQCPERPINKPLRISVNDVYKGTGTGFCVSGRVETGFVQQADKILVLPHNETALVKSVSVDDVACNTGFAGDYASLTLSNYDQQNISIGYVLCSPSQPVPVSDKFEARIVLFNTTHPVTKGFPVVLHMQFLSEQAVITKLLAELNKSNGEILKKRPRCLLKNSSATVQIEVVKPICLELYKDIKELGRFMLRVGGVTIAAGLITKIL